MSIHPSDIAQCLECDERVSNNLFNRILASLSWQPAKGQCRLPLDGGQYLKILGMNGSTGFGPRRRIVCLSCCLPRKKVRAQFLLAASPQFLHVVQIIESISIHALEKKAEYLKVQLICRTVALPQTSSFLIYRGSFHRA